MIIIKLLWVVKVQVIFTVIFLTVSVASAADLYSSHEDIAKQPLRIEQDNIEQKNQRVDLEYTEQQRYIRQAEQDAKIRQQEDERKKQEQEKRRWSEPFDVKHSPFF